MAFRRVDRANPGGEIGRLSRAGNRLSLYLFFILVGMWGVLFSTRWENAVLRDILILLSVAVPIFGVGNLLAKLQTKGYQRFLLVTGLLMLIVGAMASFAAIPGTIVAPEEIPPWAQQVSRWGGLLGLAAGLFAILFAVVHREEALDEIGQRFRYLTEHMSEGFILSSPDGTILQVNQRFLDKTGFLESEVVGRKAYDLANRLNLEPMFEHLEHRSRARASEYIVDFDVRGEKRHFSVSGTPIFNRRGEHAGTLATMRDITERVAMSRSLERYAEGLERLVEEQTQQLRQSEARMRGLLLHMNEGFLTVDASFRVRFANERLGELLGIDSGELVGRDFFDFVEAAGRGRLLRLFELAGGESSRRLQQEVELVRVDRSLVPVLVALARVRDVVEEGSRFSLVITDVSQQKGLQRQLESRASELEAANEELKMMDRAKDGFLSNVTHELRTPLSTIRGYVEMLASGSLGVMPGPQESALRVMSRNIDRLGTLIEEMIEFSRMQIKGMHLNMTLFSAEALVQDCVSSVQPQAIARNLTLNAHFPDVVAPVWGDRKRIGQVLTNLLSNAVKFTDPDGTVHVNVIREEPDTLRIAVVDTGIGIEPSYQERIFDKFFQVDSSLARRYEGAGIGLSIAKSIAEAHGGTIELKSVPDEGSTFTLILPGLLFDTAFGPAKEEVMAGRSALVIAADDEFRKQISQAFVRWGFSVSTCTGGHEGLRLARERRPDVVVVDELTADITGRNAASNLQQDPETGDIPVIVLDGESVAGAEGVDISALTALSLGKPFSARGLYARVRAACLGEDYDETGEASPVGGNVRMTHVDAVIVDSDSDMLDWIQMGLQKRGITVYCASSAGDGLDFLLGNTAGVVFVDIDSPGLDVRDTVASFLGAAGSKDAPIYIITGLPGDRAETFGCAGVLYKPFGIQEIADVIMEGTSFPDVRIVD